MGSLSNEVVGQTLSELEQFWEQEQFISPLWKGQTTMHLRPITTVTNVRLVKRGDYDVYIGRPGPWGNPFPLVREEYRPLVVAEFRVWLEESESPRAQWMRDHLPELVGKRLGCYCAPKQCHGDVLAELANELEENGGGGGGSGDQGSGDPQSGDDPYLQAVRAEMDAIAKALRAHVFTDPEVREPPGVQILDR